MGWRKHITPPPHGRRRSAGPSSRKRMVGGFYAYDNRTETKELGELCSGTTDGKGRMSCEVTLTTPGSVDLIAASKDADGHVAEAASTVWVTRQGELWFA